MAEANRQRIGILFTAFEPSGDSHAAPVIAELRRRSPDVGIFAWGGPKMAEAGATIIQETCGDHAMGLKAVSKIFSVRNEVQRLKHWLSQHRVTAHVPVDAPAANFPMCKVSRGAGARVIHLVAPQLWAWGAWRAGKLRRLTDLVLCLLPFEEEWFRQRHIPAKYIGHPSLARVIDPDDLRKRMHGLPSGAPRIALFPGSRRQEVAANIKLLVDAYTEIQSRRAGTAGLIVAASPELAGLVRRKIAVFPVGLHMCVGNAEAAIGWCDVALAVSGTISLDITAQRKPMVGVYKTSILSWLVAKMLIRSPYKLLPNIVAEREIVPEFVPHAGGCMPIVRAATPLLNDSRNAAVQSEELSRVCMHFGKHDPAREAVDAIMGVLEKGSGAQSP